METFPFFLSEMDYLSKERQGFSKNDFYVFDE